MQIPNLIRNFIRKRIVSEYILLPFFYPDEGEFESFQKGYRLVSRKTGEELAGDAPRQWRKGWRVIARNGMDDPFFVDFTLGDASPVYFAYYGAGSWEPIKVADDIVKFEEILTALAALEAPCSLEAIATLADLNNEFYRELADDYAQEDEAREEPGYKYFSVFIEDLGADKVKTLVFLKKIFEDESFAATKDRTRNLPLCVFSGIEELALPLQDKLASLGVKFYAQEISFSEFIARSG
ncbi:hypothetical protein [uncultured Campylobacter sp.]|uniref:hypothetical protein n=1 Tax=uncultured Campylobacter sp. TaxID=218934 RepID=UPI00260611DD|nr:hypothetical protein [uncultured Campylobacter sp.]